MERLKSTLGILMWFVVSTVIAYHIGILDQNPMLGTRNFSLCICTNPALREKRIHPIVLYSSFTMEPSCRFKLLLSISGYCPIILHRIKQRHIVRARFLSRARAQGPLSHFAQNTLSTFYALALLIALKTCVYMYS